MLRKTQWWKQPLIKREGWFVPLWVRQMAVALSVYYSIYGVSPVSISACHAPLLPMHDNYPAPDCGNNKKKNQGSVRRHPASAAAQNFSYQQLLCASNTRDFLIIWFYSDCNVWESCRHVHVILSSLASSKTIQYMHCYTVGEINYFTI